MKRKSKRFLAWLLSAALIATTSSIMAYADNDEISDIMEK